MRVDLLLHLRLTREQFLHRVIAHRLGERHRDLLEFFEQSALLGYRFLDVALHRLRRGELWFLRKKTDARARMWPRFALKLLVDAGHDTKQRGFSRPVR